MPVTFPGNMLKNILCKIMKQLPWKVTRAFVPDIPDIRPPFAGISKEPWAVLAEMEITY